MDDSSALGRKRVLRRAGSGDLVRPGRTAQRQQAQEQPVCQTRAAAAKKAAAAASSSSKRRRTPSPSPPLADATPEADFDLGSFSPKRKRRPEGEEDDDMEMLAQRVAKRAKASTGDEPPASASRMPTLVVISPDDSPQSSPRSSPQRGERQQEEPLRAAPDTLPPSTTPPRGASLARAPTAEPTRMEEVEASIGTGGSVPATNIGGEGTSFPQPLSTDQVDVDAVIEEVAKDAEAEATKIAAGEAAMSAIEEATKGPAGEAGKDKVNSRTAAVDKAEADFQERVTQMQVWFGEARQELKGAQDQLDKSKRELLLKQADIKKAQETVKDQAAKDEADWRQHKDEEIEKIISQRTQELERKHKDALDALALDHTGKVEKLELEREELKEEISKMKKDRDMTAHTLAELQVTISNKTQLLSKANDSIDDLKLKLGTLEGTLSEVTTREGTLSKAVGSARQLRQDDATAHKDYVDNVNLWIGRLVDVAERLTM
nr:autophagy-related protein 23-like [Aegilops tauschii subsp. strangulata]